VQRNYRYFHEPLIEVNLVLGFVPRSSTTAMIASAIPTRSMHIRLPSLTAANETRPMGSSSGFVFGGHGAMPGDSRVRCYDRIGGLEICQKTDYLCVNLTVETGHFPSWPLIVTRRP
jgi:hypothetical protein